VDAARRAIGATDAAAIAENVFEHGSDPEMPQIGQLTWCRDLKLQVGLKQFQLAERPECPFFVNQRRTASPSEDWF